MQSQERPNLKEIKETEKANIPRNFAADGYWIHDEIGPRHYVSPETSVSPDVIPKIERQLTEVEVLDASRITISPQAGEIVLTGFVDSDAALSLAEDWQRQARQVFPFQIACKS